VATKTLTVVGERLTESARGVDGGGGVVPPPPLVQPYRRTANAGTKARVLKRRGKRTCEECIASGFSLGARRGRELACKIKFLK
jgi:hypothetical protein